MSEKSPASDRSEGVDAVISATCDGIVERLVAFGRTLRTEGATVPADASIAAAEALRAVGVTDRQQVRAATKATLVAEQSDIAPFDRHFPAFWRGLQRELASDGESELKHALPSKRAFHPSDRPESEREHDPDPSNRPSRLRERLAETVAEQTVDDPGRSAYSSIGDSARIGTSDEGAHELDDRDLQVFTAALATVSGRRWEAGPGSRPDVRRALRRSVTTGGAITTVPYRRRAVGVPSYCAIVDVSRSVLDTVDRGFLLELLAGLHRESRSTRTFFFDTGVREVTSVFERSDDPVEALDAAEVAWGGGTRIGRSIDAIRRDYPHAVDAETTVIVLSDGFDVGDLELLEGGMAWLRRRAVGVLWLNPLAGTDGYEPTCGGMARAAPYVDGLFQIDSSKDLREIGRQIERRGLRGRIGYQYREA